MRAFVGAITCLRGSPASSWQTSHSGSHKENRKQAQALDLHSYDELRAEQDDFNPSPYILHLELIFRSPTENTAERATPRTGLEFDDAEPKKPYNCCDSNPEVPRSAMRTQSCKTVQTAGPERQAPQAQCR